MTFILTTRHSLTKVSNDSWPISCARRRAPTALGGAIALVSSTSRIFWTNEFLKSCITLTIDCTTFRKAVGTLADWSCCICLGVCSPDQFRRRTVRWAWQTLILPLSIVVERWDSQSGSLPLRIFDVSIVQLAVLIDADGGEWPVRHLDCDVPGSELNDYFRVCRQQFHCISQMHREQLQ